MPASVEDVALIPLFDNPRYDPRTVISTTGLFGHPSLTHPHALVSLADSTLLRAQILTNRILRARESRSELLRVVKNLDRLSDMLCGVIDLAEFVRNAHPDRMWVDAANHAYETLCEFMNVLNTHVGLYEVRELVRTCHFSFKSFWVLRAVMSDPSILKTLSPEAYKTALIFWLDFENLPLTCRQNNVPSSSRYRRISWFWVESF